MARVLRGDGAEGVSPSVSHGAVRLTLSAACANRLRDEIRRAGGREVCFLAAVSAEGEIVNPRAVARGNSHAVLAAARDASEGEIVLHNHPSGNLAPSDADLSLASSLYEQGLGSGIIDNEASRLYVVVEPPRPRVITPLDTARVDAVLGPSGALAQAHGGYEDREGQRVMARAWVERYNEGGVSVIEAGTGTGKSLAYLVPAALWALQNGERTVISTHTIHLQEQLVARDLPLLERLLGQPLRWAMVKGRGQYISIRRLLLAMDQAPTLFDGDRTEELANLKIWAENTHDGSLTDLPVLPSEDVWEEVRSDGDICLKARCPHFQRCHYHRARRDTHSAQLLVVNHALLFSDLSLREATGTWKAAAVLPPYRHLVLDEAHNVEDSATSHLGADLTRAGLFRTLSRLERNGKGMMAALEGDLRKEGDVPEARELLGRVASHLRPGVTRAREELTALFDALEPRVPGDGEDPLRLGRSDPRDPTLDPAFMERLDRCTGSFDRVRRELERIRLRLEEDPARRERFEARLLDLQSVERRIQHALDALALVLEPGTEEDGAFVRWIEGRGDSRGDGRVGLRNVRLAAAPVEPGRRLRATLFQQIDTVLLTSATLSTGSGDFRFIRDRLGLAPSGPAPAYPARAAHPSRAGHQDPWFEDAAQDLGPEPGDESVQEDPEDPPLPVVAELRVPSPFDYATQTVLGIPSDLPDPRDTRGLQEVTVRIATDLADLMDGGLFVLFTSYRALADAARRLRGAGLDRRYPLLVHGERNRSHLLDAFRASGRGILLGTASFWEGVDVPGQPLRGLILQKIPFRVPTEPLTQARTEALERRGIHGFRHYQVPLASLRLSQGFGRLIRTREDRGAVLLLDRRILSATYGRQLRDALPPAPLLQGPWPEMLEHLRGFYADRAPLPPPDPWVD
jgi:ATP-dependent DNA helicase DinG